MAYTLLINGDPEYLKMLTAALEAEGISFRVALNEEQAVRAMQDALPDVIVWDWPVNTIPPEIFLAVMRQEKFDGSLVICAPGQDADAMPYDVLIHKPVELGYVFQTIVRQLQEGNEDDSISAKDSNGG